MPTESDSQKPLALLREGLSNVGKGDYKAALTNLLEAFALEPGNHDIQFALFDLLSHTDGYELPPSFTKAIALVARQGHHDIQLLAAIVRNQYNYSDDIDEITEALRTCPMGEPLEETAAEAINEILGDPLVQLVLIDAISISPEIEDLLTNLRRFHLATWADATLDTIAPAAGNADILPALACQAFNTQYVFAIDDIEQEGVAKLNEAFLQDPDACSENLIALVASYTPLNILMETLPEDVIDRMTGKALGWQEVMRTLWRIQVLEPRYETQIQPNLQKLTALPEIAQSPVREQYERYPYPRWQTVRTTNSIDLRDYLASQFDASTLPETPEGPVNILFAGCGTGKQVISLGRAINSKNILAFDISATSLAYAYRKTQEHEMSNAHLALADINLVGTWDATFDFIICTGVLHHLDDVSKGLNALQQLAKPSTSLLIALYSERGRKASIAAQTFIKEKGLGDTLDDIRAIRDHIQALPFNHPMASIQKSQDFFSASGLHDYIFNKSELRYTPASLKSLLADHGLRFIGFHSIRGDTKQKYQALFPSDTAMADLDNWEKFEQLHPETFDNMMQFWCCAQG
ncbi:MAG: methyltransferase domain-containing protein [Kordiimonadaceae bacterium]|nr:methyltransferase domain-containing protein [Kordiimonadaceae bacterium]